MQSPALRCPAGDYMGQTLRNSEAQDGHRPGCFAALHQCIKAFTLQHQRAPFSGLARLPTLAVEQFERRPIEQQQARQVARVDIGGTPAFDRMRERLAPRREARLVTLDHVETAAHQAQAPPRQPDPARQRRTLTAFP